jgi:hypothetical protein
MNSSDSTIRNVSSAFSAMVWRDQAGQRAERPLKKLIYPSMLTRVVLWLSGRTRSATGSGV